MKKIISLGLLSAIFVAGSVLADSPREVKQDKKEIRQDAKELDQSKSCLVNLRKLTGQWHQATVDGNKTRARNLELAIVNLLVKDVNAAAWAAWQAENEAARSERETVKNRPLTPAEADDRADLRDDNKDYARVRHILKAKEHLLNRLQASNSFSYKYRLLADYQYLLERELGQARAELTEDVKELREDKR